jgi:outer membrane protein
VTTKTLHLITCIALAGGFASAQKTLPSAPAPMLAQLTVGQASTGSSTVSTTPQNVTAQSQVSAPNGQMRLAIREAEQLALRNNPRLSISKLAALVQGQITRQARSVEMPIVAGNITAVDSHEGSRITAGGLNNPIIYERAAGGVSIAQLITDFGRTRNLIASADLQQKSAEVNAQATAADIVLAVDQAFYRALNAQALVLVAEQTVKVRQNTADQITALAKAKLRSDLDLSFATVNLQQAKLLQLDAENNKAAAFADLNTLLGFEKQQTYLLIDEVQNAPLPEPPQDESALTAQAFRSRPDLIALDDLYQASIKFRSAEHDLFRPSISALAAFGGTPVRADQLTPWYGAAGVNLNIPIFNGFLFNARAREADYQSEQARERVRDLRDRIARDVRVTMLQAQSNYQRVEVSDQLLKQANLALDLAQTRYQLGLSSIVELSQAQLQQTQAEIGSANARYDYQNSLATLSFQIGK